MNKRSARIPIGCGYLFDGCLEQEFVLHEKLENTWIFSKVKKNYQQSFVAEMTLADTDRLFEIAKASPEHFTKLGLENLHVDLQNQLGLVIRHEDRICGFLLYFTHQGKAEISWMAIDPKYRSRGFGKKLLECLKDRLKSTGARDLTVRTLGDQVKYKPYDGTRRFYLHNGFKKLQSILHADNPECPEEWVMGCLIK